MIPLYVGTPPSIDSARQSHTARNMKTGSNFDSKRISNKSRKQSVACFIMESAFHELTTVQLQGHFEFGSLNTPSRRHLHHLRT